MKLSKYPTSFALLAFCFALVTFTANATADLTAPTGVLASNGEFADRTQITWNGVATATVYRAFRCMDDTTASCGSPIGYPKGTSYNDKGGVAGTTYTYRLKACTSDKCSAFSDGDTGFRNTDDPPQLNVPTNVDATDGEFYGRVNVIWDVVEDATVYRLFRCTTDSTDSCGSPAAYPNVAEYNDHHGMAGTSYRYRVKACILDKCSDFSEFDLGHRGLLAPIVVNATDYTHEDRVQVTWSPVPVAVNYRLFRCTNGTDSSTCGSPIAYPNDITFDDYTAESCIDHHYRVKACNEHSCSQFSKSDMGAYCVEGPVDVRPGQWSGKGLCLYVSANGKTITNVGSTCDRGVAADFNMNGFQTGAGGNLCRATMECEGIWPIENGAFTCVSGSKFATGVFDTSGTGVVSGVTVTNDGVGGECVAIFGGSPD